MLIFKNVPPRGNCPPPCLTVKRGSGFLTVSSKYTEAVKKKKSHGHIYYTYHRWEGGKIGFIG